MSTHDVPGANPKNQDVLAAGCWAEHDDGSLIFVEGNEGGTVVFSMFDLAVQLPVEYRKAMHEQAFKDMFSWKPSDPDSEQWTWHDKTAFPWERVMADFPEGAKPVSADDQISAARRVAESLEARAGAVRERHYARPTLQEAATKIMEGISDAIGALRG